HCNFRRQLHYPDTVRIGARVGRLGRTSLTIEHVVFSEGHDAPVADGESVVVLFHYPRQRAEVISPELRAVIEKAEGRKIV
ncbi:MAG TPA: hotdog domain-containing protein, partial [Pirellulaceae bacterium]